MGCACLAHHWQMILYTVVDLFVTLILASNRRSINSVSCSNKLPFNSDSVRQRILSTYGHREELFSFKNQRRKGMTVLRENTFWDDSLAFHIDRPKITPENRHDCRSPIANKSTVFLVISATSDQSAAILKNRPKHIHFWKRTDNQYSFYRHVKWFYFSCPKNSGCCGMHCCPIETQLVQEGFEELAVSLKRDFSYLTSDAIVQFSNRSYYLTVPNNTLPSLQHQCDYTLQTEDRIFTLLTARFLSPQNMTRIYFFCPMDHICCQLGCRKRSETTYRLEFSSLSFYFALFSVGLVTVIVLTLCIVYLF